MDIRKSFFIFMSLLFISTCLNARLIDLYKKGVLKLEADPSFGKSTPWESLFYDNLHELTVGPGGEIFVSNIRHDTIFKFNSSGELVKTFGAPGQGPGDLTSPGDISILDGKYLVIHESLLLRRISLFDLAGKCVKVLKTQSNVAGAISLKDNKIACFQYQHSKDIKNQQAKTVYVIIKDVNTGAENTIASAKLIDKNRIIMNKWESVYVDENFGGDLIIKSTKEGNLAVGVSNTPDINIYSFDGRLVRSFKLNIPPLPVTAQYMKAYRANILEKLKTAKLPEHYEKALINAPIESLFEKNLPYYRDFEVDAEGNFLFFKWTGCIGRCNEILMVYSPEGKYICDTIIEEGNFGLEVLQGKTKIVFTDKGIFGLFEVEGEEDNYLQLVKVKGTGSSE
ncbi:MAG TPA: 6-bladed beta-propeller [Candidatus Kapabacteria bacterium]|nr:6-bladed beta-propeller [Candidatus Kapabacteria bacterium]